ncbi:MAG: type IX secretion system protein PorQ [Bacteroidota bacterium]
MKFGIIIVFFVAIGSISLGQTGGNNSFPFLDLDYNARVASVGGYYLSYSDDDVNQGLINPALLNESMHKVVSVNQAFLAGGINFGSAVYAQKALKGIVSGNIRYVDYGVFQRTEVNGQASGTFRPFEYVVGVGYGKEINEVLSVGGNLNFIGSNLESYSAYGISIDMGGMYKHPNKLFSTSFLVKNAGVKFKDYTSNDTGVLPIDLQIAASYKLEHAPFRFNLNINNLNKWDLTYNDPFAQPTYDALTGDTIPVPKANFIEKTARHVVLATELSVSKSLTLRMGFNYHRRQEMKLVERPGMSGFCFGVGFKTKIVRIDYGFVMYSKAGYNNVISLSSNISNWKKK